MQLCDERLGFGRTRKSRASPRIPNSSTRPSGSGKGARNEGLGFRVWGVRITKVATSITTDSPNCKVLMSTAVAAIEAASCVEG